MSLADAIAAALKYNPPAALRAIQRALLNASEAWAANDIDVEAYTAVEEALEAMAVALEGGSAEPRRVAAEHDVVGS